MSSPVPRSLMLTCVALGSSVAPRALAAQSVAEEADRIKPLLAMITCAASEGAESFGAGILVGMEKDRVWIATAAHVVQPCSADIQVRFKGAGRDYTATVVRKADPPLDLAVLSVAGVRPADLTAVPLDRLGDPTSLKRGDPLYLVGNPAGEAWSASDTPDRMVNTEGDLLNFTSIAIAQGHSGGALLNDRWEVVGMIVADSRTGSRAVSVEKVVKTLRAWKVPVALRAPLTRISAGAMRTCAATAAGLGHCWGNIQFQEPGMFDSVLSIRGVRLKSISAGLYHVCGVAFNGAAHCLGINNYGQLGNGSTTASEEYPVPVQGGLVFASITVGGWHTCGLTPEGAAYCWGAGGSGRLGNDAGADTHGPVPVAGGLLFTSISGGLRNTCAVTKDGLLYCWGGILGSGLERGGADPPNAFVPLRIRSSATFTTVSLGHDYGCGLATPGAAFCWGMNDKGELGNGSDKTGMTDDGLTPLPVAGGHKFVAVSAGLGLHACGITTAGAAYCWGWNEDGQLGSGTKNSSNTPVAVAGGLRFASISVGHFHTCGVTTDGVIYCWGAVDWAGMGTGSTTGSTKPALKREE